MTAAFRWESFETLLPAVFGHMVPVDRISSLGSVRGCRVRLPEDQGSGHIEYITVGEALRILVMNCSWKQARSFRVLDEGWIRFNFSLDLDIDMAFGRLENVRATRPSWRIIHLPDDVETVETVSEHSRSQWVTICCRPEVLTRLSGVAQDDLPHPIRCLPQLMDGAPEVHRPFELSNRFIGITADMVNTGLKDGLRLSYLRARAVELLVLALDYVLNTAPEKIVQVRLSGRDRQALIEARDILEDNFVNPPSILELSRRIGINRNKLFYGFKSLFGASISDYIQNRRLETGHQLLTQSELTIAEVAARVGFHHQCNFSTAIKSRYGVSPSVLRRACQA